MSDASHPVAKLFTAHVVSAFLERLNDLLVLLRVSAGGRERHHRVEDLGRICRIEHQRLGEEADVVAEDDGDFVRVGGAPHVAQQRAQ